MSIRSLKYALITLLVCAGPLFAQSVYSVGAQAGSTLSAKVTNAQNLCSSPCVIVFESYLAQIPNEVLPAQCSNCTWVNYRIPLTVGTSAYNLIQLDGSTKLPAVDGSQLTNLPGGGMTWPAAAGIAQCTGTPCTAWGTSLAVPSGTLVGISDSQALTNKDMSGAGNTWPTFNQNTSGTSGGLSGSPAITVSSCAGCGSGGAVQYLSADASPGATTNTLGSSGMTFAIAASTKYVLDCEMYMQTSATSAVGFTLGVTGPGSPTEVTLTMENWTTQTARRSEWSQGSSWGAKLGATASTYDTTPLPVRLSGLIENGTTPGTLTIEYANINTTGTTTLKRGSWCKLQ